MQESDLEYVGFWPRLGAMLIDAIAVALITAPPLLWIYGTGYYTNPDEPFILGPADFLISWVFPAIGTILFWRRLQATPGKMVISARVVDARTGNTARVGQCIARYLGYFVSVAPLCLGFIWIAFDPRRQAWHDKFAGTVVIRSSHRGSSQVSFER